MFVCYGCCSLIMAPVRSVDGWENIFARHRLRGPVAPAELISAPGASLAGHRPPLPLARVPAPAPGVETYGIVTASIAAAAQFLEDPGSTSAFHEPIYPGFGASNTPSSDPDRLAWAAAMPTGCTRTRSPVTSARGPRHLDRLALDELLAPKRPMH